MLFVITGGGGYTGYHIGWKLCEGGHDVRLLDIRPPNPLWEETAPKALFDALPDDFWGSKSIRRGEMTFHKVDILMQHDVNAVMERADGVIHTASYGVSGKDQLSPHTAETERINLNGTRIILEAAQKAKVKCFVFTSTYNVVFGGEEILGEDERMELFPLYKHFDHYSRTKAIAEMAVLASNGKLICCSKMCASNQQCNRTFRTCALRFNGIFGLGECRHLPRIVTIVRRGLFLFTYGNRNALVDFVGIQNVVQAHIRALFQLLKESEPTRCNLNGNLKEAEQEPNRQEFTSGNAFFISDGSPINNFEYLKPLVEGLGYTFPVINLPFQLMLTFARIQELLYCLIHPFYPFMPYITPTEALKTGITHYFQCKKANRAFDFVPSRPNDLSQVIKYYSDKNYGKKSMKRTWKIMIICMIILIFAWLLL